MATSQTAGTIDLGITARVAVLIAACLPSFAIGGLGPVLPAIAAHFSQYPDIGALTRLMVSLIGATIVIGSPLIGMLADRYGRRSILLAGLLLYGCAGSVGFFLDNIYWLLVARAFVGLGTAAVGALALTIVVAHSQGLARNRWLGYFNTTGTACALGLGVLSGFVGRFGWQWPFLIHAMAFPLFVLTLIGLAPDRRAASEANTTTATAFNMREVPWWLLLYAIFAGIVILMPVLYVPFQLKDSGITDPGAIGVAMAVTTAASVLTSICYGRVRSLLNLGSTFILGFVTSTVGLTLIVTAIAYPILIVGLAMIGVAAALVSISIFALAGQTGPDANRARTVGLGKGGLYAGPLAGQFLLEPIVSRSNVGTALLVIGGLAMALAALNASLIFARSPQALRWSRRIWLNAENHKKAV
jgi:MFS family permease